MKLKELNVEYDKLQSLYGDDGLSAIYSGGCTSKPKICFVFMNPTSKNISSDMKWKGIRAPWIGTKEVWDLFYKTNLLDKDIYDEIKKSKKDDWSIKFANKVYDNLKEHKVYVTNLAKCTKNDSSPLPNFVYQEYLKYFEEELEIVKPHITILFGNQISSIILDKDISVSKTRKTLYKKVINKKNYKCYPVYYPVGNGRFNLDKSIEDINWIIEKEIKKDA